MWVKKTKTLQIWEKKLQEDVNTRENKKKKIVILIVKGTIML